MKSVGIVGLPGSGSSTIFTALTGIDPSQSQKAAQAVVSVPDERVDRLTELHASRKSVYAQVRFVEVSGRVRAGARGLGALPAELLGYLRECDALMLVVRAFDGGDPEKEVADLGVELALADLAPIAAKAERSAREARNGIADAKALLPVIERAREALDAGTALRDLEWTPEDRAMLSGLAPITLKPTVVVANTGEEGAPPLPAGALAVAGRLEAECAGMEPREAAELLASYGYGSRGIDLVIKAVYGALDLLTFLTAGDTESRAWPVRRGAPAPEAAGTIHSDIQRGFIRAEVCPYEDVVSAGGWPKARSGGLVRQEGKGYLMREGDVVEFRFAV